MGKNMLELDDEIFRVSITCAIFRFVCPPLQQMVKICEDKEMAKSCAAEYAGLDPDKGIPHICITYNNGTYKSLWVLMKRQKWGHVTPAQQKWLDTLNERGNLAVVCRGSKEAQAVIWDYVEFTEKYESIGNKE